MDLARAVAEEAARHPGVRLDTRPCPVRGNRLLLAQLVSNLPANAVTYNVPGGSVDVSVVPAGGGVLLEVRNRGPVMEAADIPGLFEPFPRGEGKDRMGPGSGLGQSIVRSIAVAHDGTVTAVPGPGGGLAVTVRLPAAQERAATHAGSAASSSR